MEKGAEGGHVYRTESGEGPTWHREIPLRVLRLIAETQVDVGAPILDVGGASSNLVDCLVRAGYGDVTVLDIAEAALAHARERLGADAARVRWIHGDVTSLSLGRTYALWHDGAVFRTLLRAESREAYRRQLQAHLGPGGHVVLATAGVAGAEVEEAPMPRYSAAALADALGPDLEVVHAVQDAPSDEDEPGAGVLTCVLRRR